MGCAKFFIFDHQFDEAIEGASAFYNRAGDRFQISFQAFSRTLLQQMVVAGLQQSLWTDTNIGPQLYNLFRELHGAVFLPKNLCQDVWNQIILHSQSIRVPAVGDQNPIENFIQRFSSFWMNVCFCL